MMPIIYPHRCVCTSLVPFVCSPYYMCLCRGIWAGPWIKLTHWLKYLECFFTVLAAHYRHPDCKIEMDRYLPFTYKSCLKPLHWSGKSVTNLLFQFFWACSKSGLPKWVPWSEWLKLWLPPLFYLLTCQIWLVISSSLTWRIDEKNYLSLRALYHIFQGSVVPVLLRLLLAVAVTTRKTNSG